LGVGGPSAGVEFHAERLLYAIIGGKSECTRVRDFLMKYEGLAALETTRVAVRKCRRKPTERNV